MLGAGRVDRKLHENLERVRKALRQKSMTSRQKATNDQIITEFVINTVKMNLVPYIFMREDTLGADPWFWKWASENPACIEKVVPYFPWTDVLNLMEFGRPYLPYNNIRYTHLQDSRVHALIYLYDVYDCPRVSEGELFRILEFLSHFEVFTKVLLRLNLEKRAHCVGVMIAYAESIWKYQVDLVSWWDNERLLKLVQAIEEVRLGSPDIPVSMYYFKDQSVFEGLLESLVLMRGNQQSRLMARYLHHFLSLETKVKLIELENGVQMRHELQDAFFRTLFEGVQSTTLDLNIRRDHIVRDAFVQLEVRKPYELRRQLKVKFQGEDGIDEGGLKKEFFLLFIKACFSPEYGLFKYYPDSRLHWFSPMSDDRMSHEAAEDCYAIGKIFGLAFYNNVLLDVSFPKAFYKMLVERPIGVEDLCELDPALGNGLKAILRLTDDEFLGSDLDGSPFEIEIMSGSSSSPLKFHLPTTHTKLTLENRAEFVQLYAEAILHRTVELPLQAFIRGFKFIFGKSVLFNFDPHEIEALLCGSQQYDYDALQKGTTYDGGFTARSPLIRWFWEIFREDLSEPQRHQFLAFATGNDRAPVGGLGQLRLRIVKNGPDADRLPTAHTCFNTLLLNAYGSKERLKHWLLLAIENCSGFGLQ